MANRFWVGGTSTWDATAGTKWATASGGAGGSAVPLSSDDVFLDANSGANTITITGAANCNSLNCTGFTGTLAQSLATALSIGSGNAAPSNAALIFVAGMTFTAGSTSLIQFVTTNTSATQTITSAGQVFASFTINATGVGSGYQLTDAMTTQSAATVTLTAGKFDTNSQTCTWFQYNGQGAVARTLTLGASNITLSGGASAWSLGAPGNYTFNAGTSTLTFTGSFARCQFFSAATYYNVIFTGLSPSFVGNASTWSCTVNNLTVTGTAAKTGVFLIGAGATGTGGGTITVNGTFTVAGNSVVNRVLVQTAAGNGANPGGPVTISCATAPSLSNVDFEDITAAGAAIPFTGTSMGNCLGNSNITFDTPATRYGVVAGNWSSTATWSATSGGAGGASVPLPQDTVNLNANSAAGTYLMDMPRIGANLVCSGFTRTLSISGGVTVFGDFIMNAGMTSTFVSGGITFAGRGSQIITSAGNSMPANTNTQVVITAPGGTYTLQDTFTYLGQLTVTAGLFATNNQAVNVSNMASGGSLTRSIILGTSTLNLAITSTVAPWNVLASGLTLSAASSSIVVSNASGNTRTFAGAGFTYGTLTYTVANSPGSLTITGANSFTTLNIGSGRILTMPSSTTNTITSGGSFSVNGVNNGYLYLPGTIINTQGISAPDSTAINLSGDITVDALVAPDLWTTANQVVISKLNTIGTQGYEFAVTTGGLLFFATADGTTFHSIGSTAAVGFTAGNPGWIRASRQLNNGSGSYVLKFYTSPDGVTWTQLGTTVTAAITGFTASTGFVLNVGSRQLDAFPMAGKIYETKIYNSYLQATVGTPVFDANFTTKAFGANSFTESSSNAATVTLTGAVVQAGDGRVSLVSSIGGTAATLSKSGALVSCDYLSIQDSTATGTFWYAGAHSVNVSNNTGWIFSGSPTGAPNFLPFFR